jgi:hypothetical protein
VGDGGRNDCACAGFGFSGSGDVETGAAVRLGELAFASEMESAWKNWLAGCGLPMADKGGDEVSDFRETASCFPLA